MSDETKKNKVFASALQKEMKNVEKAKKLLDITPKEVVCDIPEINEEFKEVLKQALDSLEAVNTKLYDVHKLYVKDVAPTTKKTSSRASINFKAHAPK